MRVQIVLPRDYGHAIGGYAVAYEYANQLQNRGHDVEVVHLDPERWQRLRRHPRSELRLRRQGPDWFPLTSGVKVRSVRALGRSARSSDAVIATAWQTAEAVNACGIRAPQGFYLIQGYEVWNGPEDRVHATWRMPLTRIVISSWLNALAGELNAGPVHQIPNGIDTSVFREHIPQAERAPATVVMMWHEATWKGSAIGLAALRMVKERLPELQVQFFSVFKRPHDLPGWVTWREGVRGESLCAVYNQSAIFVSPSLSEGWGLPSTEAMASGCCLVSTDIPGVADYAHQDQTALLVPAQDAQALADAVLRAITDDALRLRVAAAGGRLIRDHFVWSRAGAELETLLLHTARPYESQAGMPRPA